MISLSLAMVVGLGAVNFRYYSMRAVVRTDAYNTGLRATQLMLDSWRAAGVTTFDPVVGFAGESTEFIVATGGSGPPTPSGLTTLGTYHVTSDGFNYYMTLAYQLPNATTPTTLAVGTSWRGDYQAGILDSSSRTVWLSSRE